EITWVDWALTEKNADFLAFVKKLIAFAREQKIGRTKKFFRGCRREDDGMVCDITWHGLDLSEPLWNDAATRTIGIQLFPEEGSGFRRLFFILNADEQAKNVAVPKLEEGLCWYVVLDTSREDGSDFLPPGSRECTGRRSTFLAEARSTIVLIAEPGRFCTAQK
ncbi:MAG TPA: hypothetical protein VNX25_03605, partial [Verrucomicrobiae bacterium]|nr:hypothetical protein [Verrucomicrobiae bacterium]